MKTYFVQQTNKHQLWHIINRNVNAWIARKRIGPLNDDNKLHGAKKIMKTEKFKN